MPRERRLTWEGCVNVRDLGGHPTEDGRTTRFGAVVRADSVGRLTTAGRQALASYGIVRIVDLRQQGEASEDAALDAPVEVMRIPLLDGLDAASYADARAQTAAMDDAAQAKATLYAVALDRCRRRFADALRAVADSPPGAVVVHCAEGRDRTGLVTALLLRLCGVSRAAIDADYAAGEPRVSEGWIAAAPDPGERARRRRFATPAGAMARTLEELDRSAGSVDAYLAASGLSEDARRALRARLLG